jgi:hypothetical protein
LFITPVQFIATVITLIIAAIIIATIFRKCDAAYS